MDSTRSQFAKRNWVRTYFAWVECICFIFRQHSISVRFNKRVIRPDDIPEFSALSEVKYTVTSDGKAITERANTRTLDYIVFSLVALSKTFKLNMDVSPKGKDRENLRNALRIRDRLTHPKTVKDLNITNKDIEIVQEFADWFSAHLSIITRSEIRKKINKEIGLAKRTKKARTIEFKIDSI